MGGHGRAATNAIAASASSRSRSSAPNCRSHSRSGRAAACGRRSRIRAALRQVRRARRPSRRSEPRHQRVLSRARRHHPPTDRGARLFHRRGRGGLAGCRALSTGMSGTAAAPGCRAAVPALPDLDVAKYRRGRVRRLAARAQRGSPLPSSAPASMASTSIISTARSGPCSTIWIGVIPRRQGGARALRLPHAVAERAADLWPRGDKLRLCAVRGAGGEDAARAAGKELRYSAEDGESFLDAAQNARLIRDAERYYRVDLLQLGGSWNLRDRHMFETLRHLLDAKGRNARRSCGRTTRTSATPHSPRWAQARGDQHWPALPRGIRGERRLDRVRHA